MCHSRELRVLKLNKFDNLIDILFLCKTIICGYKKTDMLHVFEENLSVADKYGFRQADIKNISREGIKSKVVLYCNSFIF